MLLFQEIGQNNIVASFAQGYVGASLDQINDFTAKNVGQCVEELMTDLPYPEPPININYENDLMCRLEKPGWTKPLLRG
ncbi:MAG: hypothetical protein IPL20_15210 [Saprospiraceae bacterium]|nr:hypothetical protein [Saprospiraceae bacterium]